MVREFYLENEKGQQFSMMDIESYCFLSDINGLGYGYNSEYVRIGNSFIENTKNIVQGEIPAIANFKKYENYKSFVDFVERANNLKFIYKVPNNNILSTYYRDIDLSNIGKTEFNKFKILSCPVSFISKSLWYEEKETVITIEIVENEIRWDFVWDSIFSADNKNIIYENKGHVSAPFKIELSGELVNPKLSVIVNDEELNELDLTGVTIDEGEKLLYCTKDTDMYIYKQLTDSSLVSLVDNLNMNNTNFFKLPIGACTLRLTADNDISDGIVTIYTEFKSV